MKRLAVDPHHPDPLVVEAAATMVRGGGVIAYPTETFYGLGADAFSSEGSERIRRLKGRDAAKALPLIVSDLRQLETVTDELPPSLVVLAERFWPGPLTLVIPILPQRSGALAGAETAAVRVSGLALARDIARRAGSPLIATSANQSGLPPARSANEVESAFKGGVDLIVDGGPAPGGRPSTIVDLSGPEPRLLREGVIDFEEILHALDRAR